MLGNEKDVNLKKTHSAIEMQEGDAQGGVKAWMYQKIMNPSNGAV